MADAANTFEALEVFEKAKKRRRDDDSGDEGEPSPRRTKSVLVAEAKEMLGRDAAPHMRGEAAVSAAEARPAAARARRFAAFEWSGELDGLDVPASDAELAAAALPAPASRGPGVR